MGGGRCGEGRHTDRALEPAGGRCARGEDVACTCSPGSRSHIGGNLYLGHCLLVRPVGHLNTWEKCGSLERPPKFLNQKY